MHKKTSQPHRRSNSYKQLDEIVKMLVQYHDDLGMALRYAAIERENGHGETKISMLLNRLSVRNMELSKFLEATLAEREAGIQETWIQYVPNEEAEAAIETVGGDDVNDSEIVDAALDFQNAILKLLKTTIEGCDSESARDYLGSILMREQAEVEGLAIAVGQASEFC